jgi:hypothetical protein
MNQRLETAIQLTALAAFIAAVLIIVTTSLTLLSTQCHAVRLSYRRYSPASQGSRSSGPRFEVDVRVGSQNEPATAGERGAAVGCAVEALTMLIERR